MILSLLGALLLALGYPFFKLFIMSQGERLQVSDSLFSVFSVIAGSFIVTILLLSGYKRETFNQIITIATSITAIIPLAMKMFGFFHSEVKRFLTNKKKQEL